MATTEELAARLCAKASLDAPTSVAPAALASANGNFVVDGRFVLRRYRQQEPPHAALERLRRERWTLETLAAAGVPVTRVLAACEEPGAESLLIERAEGESLGSWAARLPAADAAGAWAAAGRALAGVHAVAVPPAFSRGPWHHEQALANLDRLSDSRPDLDSRRLRAAVEAARPLYEQAPLALCQCDAHLWQFMLVRRGRAWDCTAILDWEHADLDDPDYDLAQLDGFRFAPVGPVPPEFFAAYGRTPSSPLYPLYRVERAAWILDAHARGVAWPAESVPLAESFLRSRIGA